MTIAWSANGAKAYALVQSASMFNHAKTDQGGTILQGVYAANGSFAGPWNKIAEWRNLQNSGSALGNNSKGYHPGVQAWYNQFLVVDPANANHLFLGLEEVFETTNGGVSWRAAGPYWNFGLPCAANGLDSCPPTTHPDQHAVAIAGNTVYVGNDGGVYKRGLTSTSNFVHLNDGLNTLQYYYADAGPGLRRRRAVGRPAGQRRVAAHTRGVDDGVTLRRRRRRHSRRSHERQQRRRRVRRPRHGADDERRRVQRRARLERLPRDLAVVLRLHVHAEPVRSAAAVHRTVRSGRDEPGALVRGRRVRLGQPEQGLGHDVQRDGLRLEDRRRHRRRSLDDPGRGVERHVVRRVVRSVQLGRLRPRHPHELRRDRAPAEPAGSAERQRARCGSSRASTSSRTTPSTCTPSSTGSPGAGPTRSPPARVTSSSRTTAARPGRTSAGTCRMRRATTSCRFRTGVSSWPVTSA